MIKALNINYAKYKNFKIMISIFLINDKSAKSRFLKNFFDRLILI